MGLDRSAVREHGIDAFRFLLMPLIVLSHAWFYSGPLPVEHPAYLLLLAGHCAVPFFFIASGYLLRLDPANPFATARWACGKLLPLFGLWMILYLGGAWFMGAAPPAELLATILQGGPTRHLWFLPALAFGLSAVSLCLHYVGVRWTWIMLSALATIGLLHATYLVWLGSPVRPLHGGMATAPFFVMLGTQLAHASVPRLPRLFAGAVLLTYLVQLVDDMLVSSAPAFTQYALPIVTAASIPFALAVFLFARSLHNHPLARWLAPCRKYVLTIYCIHPAYLALLAGLFEERGLTTALLMAGSSFVLSMITAALWAGAKKTLRGRQERPSFATG